MVSSEHDFNSYHRLIDIINEEFKTKTEQLIIERINETNVLKTFEMALALGKVKLMENCVGILKARRFKDIIHQREQFNKLSEVTFKKILEAHYQEKKKSEDQYLQFENMQHAIRDYCIENYYDENIREKKISQFSKLLLTTNFAEYDEEFE